MPERFDLANVTVLLAVGGRATRALEMTADTIPKHLIRLENGPTILEVVCRQLQLVGFRKFVFCTGHHLSQIAEFARSERWISHDHVLYGISGETEPLGLEGTILSGINNLGITGQAMFIVGDAMMPWDGLAGMNERHAARQAPVTWGVTSYITERTVDAGKIIVDPVCRRVLRVYGRTDEPIVGAHEVAFTSAGVWAVSIERYLQLCQAYKASHSMRTYEPIGPHDSVVLWAVAAGRHCIYGHDLRGEVLDLGTPENIRYGLRNWRKHILG